MFDTAKFYGRAIQLLAARRLVSAAAITSGYDRISPTYDDYFSRRVARHSLDMLARLAPPQAAVALDLACGTGTLALGVAEIAGPHGTVTGVDRSQGMLEVARAKAISRGLHNVELRHGDMCSVLHSFDAGSLDIVTCGWALGYVKPVPFIRSVAARLKPGGSFGVIENTRGTLEPIRKTAIRVAGRSPGRLEHVMDLHLRLPTGEKHLTAMLRRAGLKPADVWEGEIRFQFKSGAAVLEWVLHTGAGAGYSRMMSPGVSRSCDELFVRLIEDNFMRNGIIEVSHRYVSGIATKD
jgi:ubiquinone/menaquinone biosynthesis C-methylase UbiE